MRTYLIPAVLGLLMGLLLNWAGFSRADELRLALGLKRGRAGISDPRRSGMTAIGYALTMTAFLTWLAVIDVDDITVLPLSLGALAGGVVFGVAAGLCGFTPTTAFAGLGAGNAPEALCVLAGCCAGCLLLRLLDNLLSPLRTAAPYADATLFRTTLTKPWLLGGGFLAQGCVGVLLAVIALCIPSPRPVILTDEEVAARAAGLAALEEEAGEAASTDPEVTREETFVALLEGEEPLVVDTDAAARVPGETDPPQSPEETESDA